MKKITLISSVFNGNLKRNRNKIREAIAAFEGKEIELTIQKKRKVRSTPQNSYYWGVVLPIVQDGLKDATGEVRDLNSIHYQILLPLMAPKREIVNTETGEVITERMTSSEMTTTEFSEYVMEIQAWGAEFLGIRIPDPNEQISLV